MPPYQVLFTTFFPGYFIGSIPVAALVALAAGKDIFALGSGSMGAMNTARNLHPTLGLLVFVLDVLKGAAATYIGMQLGGMAQAAYIGGFSAGIGAVAGHLWSVWVGFRGGKGLATTLGVALPIYPLGGLLGTLALGIFYLLTRRLEHQVDTAILLTAFSYPFLVHFAVHASALPGDPLHPARHAAGVIALMVGSKTAWPLLRQAFNA